MNKRDKVIKGLECCSKGCSNDCTYLAEGGDCCTALAADALELIKAQDETRLLRHFSRPNVYADLWLHCEKCGEKVNDNWRPKYCPGCGRKVLWND